MKIGHHGMRAAFQIVANDEHRRDVKSTLGGEFMQ